ncbi:ROK family protein [Microbacterium horticulturae]|uniref:ROK family protein n=1 Tax=Microbacterium horticulturae TaxID=3028316 RepID=A0ABY8BWM1_9MICO|nr:ROK family protein [Microbacterium sp. KACC 23027]WEG07425.1 ROK family protein [Microbacterium sp. KACC 23027]
MGIEDSALVGIDIGGTKIAAVLVDEAGAICARGAVAAPASSGGDAMVDAAAGLVTRLAVGASVRAVGVGAAGVVDHRTGEIRAASELFHDWAGYPLGDRLSARLEAPVRVENDVNAFLLGELAWGAAQGADVLGVMLGTGVGGAVALDGVLRHGPHGAAGEIGHTPGYSDIRCTCGQVGHLETVASGTSIARRYAQRTGSSADAAQVAEYARAGDPDAAAVFDDAGRALTLACATVSGIVEVGTAVIGGGVARSWDLLEPAIARTLRTDAPISGVPLRIVPGSLGGDAVALGAASAARSHLQTPVL